MHKGPFYVEWLSTFRGTGQWLKFGHQTLGKCCSGWKFTHILLPDQDCKIW